MTSGVGEKKQKKEQYLSKKRAVAREKAGERGEKEGKGHMGFLMFTKIEDTAKA